MENITNIENNTKRDIKKFGEKYFVRTEDGNAGNAEDVPPFAPAEREKSGKGTVPKTKSRSRSKKQCTKI